MNFQNLDYTTLTAALAGFKAEQDGGRADRAEIISAIQKAMTVKRLAAVVLVCQQVDNPSLPPIDTVVLKEVKPHGRVPRIVGDCPQHVQNAMLADGIRCNANEKGDRLVEYVPSRPKHPYVYQSARGTRWKASIAVAQERFGKL